MDRQALKQKLKSHFGKLNHAAQEIGVHPSTLRGYLNSDRPIPLEFVERLRQLKVDLTDLDEVLLPSLPHVQVSDSLCAPWVSEGDTVFYEPDKSFSGDGYYVLLNNGSPVVRRVQKRPDGLYVEANTPAWPDLAIAGFTICGKIRVRMCNVT